VGVARFNNNSGGLKGRRRIWGGRSHLRSLLYMCVVSGIRLQREDPGILPALAGSWQTPESGDRSLHEKAACDLKCDAAFQTGMALDYSFSLGHASSYAKTGDAPRGGSPLVGGAAKQRVGGTRPHRLSPKGKRERGY
jgi:hypothetical protein